jgi:hypothetical protein
MIRVMFISSKGENVVKDMSGVPRLGEMVPIFIDVYAVVTKVVWMPHIIYPQVGDDVDVLVTL